MELKLNAEAVDALNELAEARNMNRSDLIEEMLMNQLATLHSRDKSLKILKKHFHVAECSRA